jgi:hypothetical protein
MLDMIHYKKFPFKNFRRNYHVQRSLPVIPVLNQTHPILSHFINMDYFIIFKSGWGNIGSTLARIYAGRSVVQILAGARKLTLLQNIQPSSSAQPASNSMKTTASSLAVKWPGL